ncbi:MAG: hypothetical protein ACI84D_003563, partial [Thalassolituus oleivorans]
MTLKMGAKVELPPVVDFRAVNSGDLVELGSL